jgi:hypothetical protein
LGIRLLPGTREDRIDPPGARWFDARNDIFPKKMKMAVERHDQLVCGEMANPVINLVVISHRETLIVRDFLVEK